MKTRRILVLIQIIVLSSNFAFAKFQKVYVYHDAGYKGNNYIPSGYMGDYSNVRIQHRSYEKPRKGKTCMKIVIYKNKNIEKWCGVYWQYPVNNWGTEPNTAIDVRGAKKLTFYARGHNGGEIIDTFKLGGIKGDYSDTAEAETGMIRLSKKWKKYKIDLRDCDLSHIIGGFCFVITNSDNPKKIIFYMDEVVYE
jgi:hypothetical protein